MALQTILLALTVLWAAAQTPPCRILGRATKPSFYQHGDINIGGVFSLHDIPLLKSRRFDTKPEPLKCSRVPLRAPRAICGNSAPVPTPRLSAAPRFEGYVPWASPAPVPDPTAGVPSLSWTPRPGSRLVPVPPHG
ncbi:hypothetical protein SKAU_G00077980 [Synaphobranchus kaupii]|uniref:Uncharacterized protein n=1 Tax=Synaphobranchus kaupii TaxID=118154 RepID=A0A9Q1J311_SYNKA|nr:hypothetical protein SKAU_G00077980 [Synaphobranchus kaupii]